VGVRQQQRDIEQGWSVALSLDGNTAVVGGPTNNGSVGNVWTFTRKNGTWTQGSSRQSSNFIGGPNQGYSVALAGDGTTVLVQRG
jgi:hypothetical protein